MSGFRLVESEADAMAAPPLRSDESGIQVRAELSGAAYRHLATLLAARPDAWLFLNAHRATDLEALARFPGLRRLQVTLLRLESWDGLRHVADSLEALTMGDGTLRPLSIAPMAQLSSLRSLGLVGPVRDVDVLERLRAVEELSLRSITLPDLAPLTAMPKLRSLWLGLGGTSDLSLLPELRGVEELELWRIRGLRDVSPVASLPNLRSLVLQSISAVTDLPSFREATALRRVALDTMKGITDLSPLAEAPHLEELLLIAMRQLDADSLRPFVGHPSLKRGVWGFGSTRKNVAAYDLLPLGEPPYGHPSAGVSG